MTDNRPPAFLTPVDLPFPPAQRLGAQVEYHHFLPHEKSYTVNVVFVRQAPDPATIERVLRECLGVAAAHDGRFLISGEACLAPGDDTDPEARKALLPWGKDHFLCFDAGWRQIGVRRHGAKHFEAAHAITDVLTIGSGDNVDHPDRPINPLNDNYLPDEDGFDDATQDMCAQVLEWAWYGYYTAEAIMRWIDEGAAAGEGFDHECIKSYAEAVLEKKRAAEARWPQETDCDRLDRAYERLGEQGVLVLQWAGNTLSDGIAEVGEALDAEGVAEDTYQGFCFFHSQDIDRALGDEGLMLAFGSATSDEDDDAVRIGRLVCEAFRQEGFQIQWNGTADQRIAMPAFRWQRRTPLD